MQDQAVVGQVRDRSRSREREERSNEGRRDEYSRGSSSYYARDRDSDRNRDNQDYSNGSSNGFNYGKENGGNWNGRRQRDDCHYGRDGRSDYSRNRTNEPKTITPEVVQAIDTKLVPLNDDPRVINGKKQSKTKGGGRNTESFDPRSTLVRPDMRIICGPNRPVFGKKLKHDDVVIVNNFLCDEDDWTLYYKLIEEMREAQALEGNKGAEWISWAEGAHLISKNPNESKTYAEIQEKIAAYFEIERKSVGTRFNWYRDSSDWKPFHHDSAAFNPQRARNQNITVGISLGSSRELAFLHATSGDKIYFPQTNGMLFAFGRDVNIHYKHAINALPTEEYDGKGRISIILWGLVKNVVEEDNSPRMLDDNTRGGGHSIHANRGNNNYASGRSFGPPPHRNDGSGGENPCRDFQKGNCSRGDGCRYSHK